MRKISIIIFILTLFSFSAYAGDEFNRNDNDDKMLFDDGCFMAQGPDDTMHPPFPGNPWLDDNRDGPRPGPKQIERFRLLKLLELLNLDEKKEAEFITVFRSYRDQQRDIMFEKINNLKKLSEGLREDTISDQEITDYMSKMTRLNQDLEKNADTFLKKLSSFLTTKEIGKVFVFEDRFEAEILAKMSEFRRGEGPKQYNQRMRKDMMNDNNTREDSSK